MTSRDLDGWFRPSFLQQLQDLSVLNTPLPLEPTLPPMVPLPPLLSPPSDEHATQESLTIGVASSVAPAATLNKIVPSGSVPSAMSLPRAISPWLALPDLPLSLDDTSPLTVAALLMLNSEVAPQMYNRGIVTEIPFVDESSEWELLLLLGDWYEPESFESVVSSIASDAVFFSS